MEFPSKRPLVGVTFLFICGIIIAFLFPSLSSAMSLSAFGSCLFLWIMGVLRKFPLSLSLVIFFGAVFFAGVSLTQLKNNFPASNAIHRLTQESPTEVKLRGRIVSLPLQSPKSESIQCILEVEELSFFVENEIRQVTGRVWAKLFQNRLEEPFWVGDELEIMGFIQAPFRALNPGQFDQSKYLAHHNIYRTFIGHEGRVKKLGASFSAELQRRGQQFRYYMNRALTVGLEDDRLISSLLAGMLYGDRTAFSEILTEKFRRTGTLHLFAVSGQNVGILAAIGLVGLRLIGLSRWRWGWILIPLLLIYTIATGSQPSALRAWVMASFFLLAWFLDRPAHLLQLTCGAALVILTFDPNQLKDIGFQLSFLVVFALILIAPKIYTPLKKIGAPDSFFPRQLWPKWYFWREPLRLSLWGAVAASGAAFIGAMPLTLYYFNLWIPISLLVNVAVVLFACIIVFIATLSVALYGLFPSLAVLCNNANWLMAKLLLFLITTAFQIPEGSRYVPAVSMWFQKKFLRLTVLSLGSGQACVLKTPLKTELWDVGGKEDFSYVVGPALKKFGINRLDRVWLSQGVENHIGGTLLLWPHWQVTSFLKANLPQRSSTFKKIDRLIPETQWQPLNAPFTIYEKEYRWEILYPYTTNLSKTAQNKALVARLIFPTCSLLLANDIGASVENELIRNGAILASDILIQGNHAKEENLTEAFLKKVKPKHLFYPGGGYWNWHLNPEQTQRLSKHSIQVWNLKETGALTVKFQPEGYQIESFIPTP